MRSIKYFDTTAFVTGHPQDIPRYRHSDCEDKTSTRTEASSWIWTNRQYLLLSQLLFPTCQVRVCRFYQSCFLLLIVLLVFPQLPPPDLSGHCGASTAGARSQWARPGQMPDRMSDRCQIECQKVCQRECQKEYQNVCQNSCQKVCQNRCQIEC